MSDQLVATSISVHYGAVRAVTDVTLAVQAGEIVALLGANGAGKTSLLRAISGLVPTGGTVRVSDTPVTTPVMARQAGVLHVPQGRGLFRRLTVEQNLVLGAAGGRAARANDVERASTRIPELSGWLGRRVETLSGGEQALVALGRLLAGMPRYALVDELALGLAPIAADRLDRELTRLRDDGVGILLVEQYAPRALALADRVVILERGSVVYDGDPSGAGTAESLVSSYLGAPR